MAARARSKPSTSKAKPKITKPVTQSITPDGRVSEYAAAEDKCPICKSDRYLNPKLRLLVSTKCFHRLCEGCIDRIFTLGPEPCPICGVELRKTGFMAQTYEDLKVEKEVSIRKRIAKCFNKRQHDFPDLQSYNNYLEEVEDITFNLINSVDVAATEARIKSYQTANAALIAQNARLDSTDSSFARANEAKENAERARKRQLVEKFEREEEADRLRDEKSFMEKLQGVDDEKEVERLQRKQKREAKEKRDKMGEIPEEWLKLMGPSAPQEVEGEKEAVMDEPLSDLRDWYDYSGMYDLPDEGFELDPWTEFTPAEEEFRLANVAAGYRVEEVWDRALRSGVMGLFVKPVAWTEKEQGKDVTMSVA